MSEQSGFSHGARTVLVIAAVIVVILGMKAAADIINSIALALVLAVSMTPILNWLIKKGVPRGIALLLVIILVVLVIMSLIIMVTVSMQNVIETLPTYQEQLQGIQDNLYSFLEDYGIDLGELKNAEFFSSENLIYIGAQIASSVVNILSSWFFMLLLVTYMLMEAIDFPAKVRKTLDIGRGMPDRLFHVSDSLRSYISMTVWLGAFNAIVMTVIMYVMGVDFAGLWGILTFIMSFIPYVGFVISLMPPTIMALLESGWTSALIIVGAFLIVNTLIDNVIKPRVMGEGLDLSPVVIMLSLFFWAWVLGPMGALLAIPMTIIVKGLILESSDDTVWIANLMMPLDSIPGDDPGEKASD